MSFSRWKLSWDGKTWAYRLFKGHHTELNNLYWAHAAVFRHTFAATRPFEREQPASVLFDQVDEAHQLRNTRSLGEWACNYNAFDNWVRLNCLVSATGYLEVYVKTAVRLALESDPGVMLASSRSIDGVALLKTRREYSFAGEATDCVRGTWGSREAHYRKLFGTVPSIIQTEMSALEDLRNLRNGVTHVFGRSSDEYESLRDIRPKAFRHVSLKKLKASLALIERVASEIDNHLGPKHIGDYEPIYFYHHWDRIYDRYHFNEPSALRNLIGKHTGTGRNIGYFRSLIKYYEGVR